MKHDIKADLGMQKGMVLFVVLMIGIVIVIIAAVTSWTLKNNLQAAGKQRKDFQSLHAAEAGIKYFQNQLNALNFCQPWFGYDDSVAVARMLKSVTITLPSPYDSPRGFRIQNAAILPNIRPFGIRFESVGGNILPDGSLDLNHGRPIVCDIYMRTPAEFSLFNETGDVSVGATTTIQGRFFAGKDLYVASGAIFEKLVSLVGTLFTSGDPANISFKKGRENVAGNPYNLDNIHISMADPRSLCSGSLPRTYEELAKGTVPNEGIGFAYSGPKEKILVNLDEVTLTSGVVQVNLYEFDSTRSDGKGALAMRRNVAQAQFNGTLFVNGDVFLKGSLSGVSLTVVSTDDIFATDNILCSGTVAGSDAPITLGIIAQSKFVIWSQSPSRQTIEASIIVEDDSLVELGLPNPFGGSWGPIGSFISHRGVDANGNPAPISDPANWVFNLRGGILSKAGGGFPTPGDSTKGWPPGNTRKYAFDPDNVFNPPPHFPMLNSATPGLSRWDISGWQEK
jgi:hypothetical protein